jgi:D-alanyl-D-alanine carboxypeptidase (penicillin-binding protein 5/6)
MSRELMKHDRIRQYTEKAMDSLRGGESELVNTNKLVRYYDGCYGLKTGTTSGAGSCLSAIAERDGLTLVAVVLGAPSSKDRFSGTQKLLDYGFANYSFAEIEADTEALSDIPVRRGRVRSVTPVVGEKFFALLKKGEESKITQTIELETELTAPIKEGATVGYVHIMLGEEELGVIPITARTGSEAISFWYCLTRLLQSLFTL